MRRHDELRGIDNDRRRETLIVLGLFLAFMWSELQRRLGILNHAHEQAVEVQHTYVTDEKFGDFVKRYDENREAVSEQLAERRGDRATAIRWTAIAVTIAVTIAVGFIGAIIIVANILTAK
jgi:hypothetical protein